MKKVFVLMAFAMTVSVGAVVAQTTVKEKVDGPVYKSKTKPTSTVGEKVHNVFSKHKKHSGAKAKHKNKETDAKTKTEVHTKG